jgi:hypothetical protein
MTANKEQIKEQIKEIPLLAGQRPDGELVFEQVSVQALSEANSYRLLLSPAFSKGLAKGDEIRLLPAGRFEMIQHSGNLCVRVFAKTAIAEIARHHARVITELEGSLDIQNERMLVYCIPVSKGFTRIEEVFNGLVEGRPDATWIYGNVYDPADGTTALNWWQPFLSH